MDKRAFSIGHSLLVYIRHCDSGHENGFVYSGVLIIHLPEAEQNSFLGKKIRANLGDNTLLVFKKCL